MLVRIRITHPARRTVATPAQPPGRLSGSGSSSRVAIGILLSRITGLARETVFAHYFGASALADAFRAANRIPNTLNNLFGEGVLSAAFVTVYSKLRALKEDEEAEHVAEAVFGVLAVVCSVIVLIGVLAAPVLVSIIAFGFSGEKRAITITLVRILFPGTGMLVMGAWCLGVLNSHRRFLLSYTAPVAQNATMILCLLGFGAHRELEHLAIYLAWASVLGSVLIFLIQLPRVLSYLPAFRPSLNVDSQNVKTVLGNFGPVFLGRGVVQLSALIDSMIASKLPTGAVADLGYAQIISILPISLFSMSISAAELPALSSAVGDHEQIATLLRTRLEAGLRRIAFFIVPSAAAFLLLGDVLSAALFQSGRFTYGTAIHVWSILAGSAVGLLASAMGRLYSSAYYALLDTRTPLRFAVIRVTLTIALGFFAALVLPGWFGIDRQWGVAGLTASAGIAGWVEFALLRRGLAQKIGPVHVSGEFIFKLWSAAAAAGIAGYILKLMLGTSHPRLLAFVVVPVFAAIYFSGTASLGIPESQQTIDAVLRRFRR